MEFKAIDINTIVVDDITYTAVEHSSCGGCEFQPRGERCSKLSCSSTLRPDHRSVIWKRKTTDIQNESSSEYTKPIDIKVVNENKIIIDGVEYRPENFTTCKGCAFIGVICHKYYKQISCSISECKDSRSVIWKKVPDKQTHVSLSKIRRTKVYKLNFKP